MEDPIDRATRASGSDVLVTLQSWPQLKAMVYFDVHKDGSPWITDSSSASMAGYRDLVNGIVTVPCRPRPATAVTVQARS